MSDVEAVMVRDLSSGRIHKRFRIQGQTELAAFEQDNSDEAGAAAIVTDADIADAPQEAFCRRCFAIVEAP